MTIFSFYRVVHIESFSKKIEKQKKKLKLRIDFLSNQKNSTAKILLNTFKGHSNLLLCFLSKKF